NMLKQKYYTSNNQDIRNDSPSEKYHHNMATPIKKHKLTNYKTYNTKIFNKHQTYYQNIKNYKIPNKFIKNSFQFEKNCPRRKKLKNDQKEKIRKTETIKNKKPLHHRENKIQSMPTVRHNTYAQESSKIKHNTHKIETTTYQKPRIIKCNNIERITPTNNQFTLRQYKGTRQENLVEWIHQFESWFMLSITAEELKTTVASMYLTEIAFEWFDELRI
ncbi:hypothetical protein EDEG_04167, partial [Edhazardia aedis USNM 41457]